MLKKSILLIDDEEILLESLTVDLEDEGYLVTKAKSGETALLLLRDNAFDLVVSDLVMPGVDGLQVLKEVKKINVFMGVIILTGYGDMKTAIQALRLGADDYVLKPCEPDECILRIKNCLAKQEAFLKVNVYEQLLPVCSYCKKIRDDSGREPGQGVWMDLAEYLRSKGGPLVTHGCCPECFCTHIID